MSFDDIVGQVSAELPNFNKHALTGLTKEAVAGAPEYIALVFREMFKLVRADIELMDYKILDPEAQVHYELRPNPNKPSPVSVPLYRSFLRLVRYRIRFEDQFLFVHLYVPTMLGDMFCIDGKLSIIRKLILEKAFAKIQEPGRGINGITVSPIRVNVVFNRKKTIRITSYVDGACYDHFIVTAKMYYGKIPKKICEVTIIHYMLAKFGFDQTLKRFGIRNDEIRFVDKVGNDVDDFEYFAAMKCDNTDSGEPTLFLRVRRELLMDDQVRKFVVNMVYITSFFDIQTIDNVYREEGSIWKVILGIILYCNRSEPIAYSHAENILHSVDHFADPPFIERLVRNGIPIKDTYDLLVYVFLNIDTLMLTLQPQNLYNSRIDIASGLLGRTYAEKINNSIYSLMKRSNITYKHVASALRFSPMLIRSIKSRPMGDMDPVASHPEIVGDNFLFSGGLIKIRLGGKAEQRLHPSMMVVEAIDAFSGDNIAKTGFLNPYVPTDRYGFVQHPDYADEADEILKYLPR